MNDIRKQSYYSAEEIETAIQAVIKASNTFIENNIDTLAKAVVEAKIGARGGN